MLKTITVNDFTRLSSFSTPSGCDEFFMAIDTQPGLSFIKALDELASNYSLALKHAGLSDDTAVFSRLFVSDITTQKKELISTNLFGQLTHGALSVIEQRPVNGGPLSLLSYHLRSGKKGLPREITRHSPDGWQNSTNVKGKNYSLLFTADFTDDAASDIGGQTMDIFESLAGVIAGNDMRFTDNAVRTWVFVRDIDNNYGDMVKARREFFSARGLTDKTRYLASTGIQGTTASAGQFVSIDSLSIGGLRPEQIVRMEAPDHLSSTFLYGVTFERGLRVRFGDRSHLYISGTASIDHKGDVLFIGDAARQAERTIENIKALLAAHKAVIGDMAYLIAYVRNSDDRDAVRRILDRKIGPGIPMVFAEAAVCRPTWLVELEGLALIPDKSDFPPFA
jgi:enamine deaminase RidA (YjgF/YER057c/UK114 family)